MTPVPSMSSLAGSASWVYLRTVIAYGAHFGALAILARELDPALFGIVAMANIVIALLTVLAADGVNQFVVYDRQSGSEGRAQAAFWLNATAGVAAAGLGVAAAGPASRFFAEPLLAALLPLLLLRFPFEACTRVVDAVQQKELRFKPVEAREALTQIAIAAASIVMALLGYGVWSLVVPVVAAAPVQLAVSLTTARWSPGGSLRVSEWPRILGYSRHVVAATLTNFVINEGDNLLIGRLLGANALGLYAIAWRTSNLITKILVQPSTRLFYPYLASVAGRRSSLTRMLRRLLGLVSFIAFPLFGCLLVFADDLVMIVYGPKWEGAVLPLRILSVYAMRYAVGSLLAPVFNALGRPDLGFKIGLGTVPFFCLAIWFGSAYGIVGIALAVTVLRSMAGMVTFAVVARLLGVRMSHLLKPLAPNLIAVGVMTAVTVLAKALTRQLGLEPGLATAAALVPLAIVVYLAVSRFFFPRASSVLDSAFAQVRERLTARHAAAVGNGSR